MIAEYSKGMRKRVAMAAALIHRPQLFLMDEPFEGVDAVGARLMKDILLDQVRREHGADLDAATQVQDKLARQDATKAVEEQILEHYAGVFAAEKRR